MTAPPRPACGLRSSAGEHVTLIRVAFVIFALTGIGELVYLLLWIFAPKAARE
jgi:phage shock protein PspC (stress-responsive transcriptional regulator)